MSWVVVLDNGRDYESHRRLLVAACRNNVEAQALRGILKQWLADRPRDKYDPAELDETWEYDVNDRDTRHPWPFDALGLVPSAARCLSASIQIQYVPDWTP